MSSDVSSVLHQDKINSANSLADRFYEFDRFRLDASHRMLYERNLAVPLAPKVVETLIALVERGGEVISKDELMNRLWADSFVEESNLTQNIYLLRKTLGKGSDGRDLIETFRRRGYRFTGEIRGEDIQTNGNAAVERISTGDKTVPVPRSNKKWIFAITAIAAAASAIFVVLLASPFTKRRESKSAAPTITLKRLTPDINAFQSAISPDGKYLIYTLVENEKKSLWVKDIATGGAKQIMPPSEEVYGSPQISPDGSQIYFTMMRNNRAAIVRMPFRGGSVEEISPETTSPFAFSPDGVQIAFVRDQSLMIARSDGSSERVLSKRGNTDWFESWGSQLSWSPDGKSIAVCGGRRPDGKLRFALTEIFLADASERDIPIPDWEYLDSVQWIPDGSGMLVIARETSGSPFQIWRLAYPSGAANRVTQDIQDYIQISISADSRLLLASQRIGNHNIWIGPLGDARQAKQVTFGTAARDGYFGVAAMPDGRVVYTSPRGGDSDLWIMNADGSNQKQLTSNAGENVRPAVSTDGRYIYFQSDRGGVDNRIWRIDADGGNPQQIISGDGPQERPIPAPDGQWIYFNWSKDMRSSIWKVPVEGGEPVPVHTDETAGALSVSPDGKLLAVSRYDAGAKVQWQQGVMRADTGEIVRWFDKPLYGPIGWTPDSKSVVSLVHPNNVNLVQQPIDGAAARTLTNFDSQQLRTFAISPDGKTLVVSRGNISYEAVLITDFKP